MNETNGKIGLILLAFATMLAFNILNLIALKTITNAYGALTFVVYTIPIQFVTFFGIISYFAKGSKTFNNRYWVISVIFTLANYSTNLLAAYLLIGQIPVSGQAIGLILAIAGAFIAVFWK